MSTFAYMTINPLRDGAYIKKQMQTSVRNDAQLRIDETVL